MLAGSLEHARLTSALEKPNLRKELALGEYDAWAALFSPACSAAHKLLPLVPSGGTLSPLGQSGGDQSFRDPKHPTWCFPLKQSMRREFCHATVASRSAARFVVCMVS